MPGMNPQQRWFPISPRLKASRRPTGTSATTISTTYWSSTTRPKASGASAPTTSARSLACQRSRPLTRTGSRSLRQWPATSGASSSRRRGQLRLHHERVGAVDDPARRPLAWPRQRQGRGGRQRRHRRLPAGQERHAAGHRSWLAVIDGPAGSDGTPHVRRRQLG